MIKKALIVVDYSNDFIATDGKLTCGHPGQSIEEYIKSRLEAYHAAQQDIIFTMDLHYEEDIYHPETHLFPPHNLAGTHGRELYGTIGDFYKQHQDQKHIHYLDKRRYDSFYGTPLDSLLRERHIDTIEIVGVCTDICILHTAISAYNLGYNIHIPAKGVASFNPAGHAWALQHFKNTLGAEVEE